MEGRSDYFTLGRTIKNFRTLINFASKRFAPISVYNSWVRNVFKINPSYKLFSKSIIKHLLAKLLVNLQFINSAIKYGKGIGWNAPLKSEVEFLINNDRNPFILFDVGANMGEYSTAVSKLYPKSTTYSFEPAKTTFDILKKNVSLFPNIIPIKIAFGDERKNMTLYADYAGSSMASLYKRNLSHAGIKFDQSEIIVVETLDEWVTANGVVPDYIKIDVEGFELSVLNGAIKTLEKVRAIQFEFGGSALDARLNFRDYWIFFEKLNFRIYRYTPLGLLKIEEFSEQEEIYEFMNYIAIPFQNNRS
jgi:FkbM family methyltransferase